MVGTSLVVQWLRLHVSNVGGMGSIPGQGTKIPHAEHGTAEKKKRSMVEGGDQGAAIAVISGEIQWIYFSRFFDFIFGLN